MKVENVFGNLFHPLEETDEEVAKRKLKNKYPNLFIICPECQFEDNKHSLACSRYKPQEFRF